MYFVDVDCRRKARYMQYWYLNCREAIDACQVYTETYTCKINCASPLRMLDFASAYWVCCTHTPAKVGPAVIIKSICKTQLYLIIVSVIVNKKCIERLLAPRTSNWN